MATEKKLKATLVIGGALSSSLKMALGSTKDGLKGIGSVVQSLTKRQALLNKSIQTFGRMGKDVSGMRDRYAALTAQLERARAAQARLNAAQERYQTLTGIGSNMAMAGVGATLAGGVILRGVGATLSAAKAYQQQQAKLAGLGLSKGALADATNFANRANIYGVSKADKLGLMTDAISIFGNVADAKMALPMIAKAYFANRALYGDEAGGEKTDALMTAMKVAELRGGTSSPAEFARQVNMIQQVINATQGKVGADQWKDLIATGGTAVKGMGDKAFYYELEPAVQEMGGHRVGTALQTAYQELYQGHTTKRAAENLEKYGLIGDKSKLSFDKSGQIAFLNPGALKGSGLFQTDQFQWMKQVLLPALAKQGIASKKGIEDAIGSIMGRTAANLYSTWATQQQQVDRRAKQNAQAQNVDQMNAQAQQTAAGKELNAEAKLADLKLRMGTDIIPLYTSALTMATHALEWLNKETARHPRIAKAMMIGLAAIGATLAVVGPVLVTVGGALATYAGFSLAFTKFGIAGSGAFRAIGTAAMWLGRAALPLVLSPIGLTVLAIGALAAGAFLVWKYWKPIKAFFKDLWGGVKATFQTVVTWIENKMVALGEKLQAFMHLATAPFRAGEEAGGWVAHEWNKVTGGGSTAPSLARGGGGASVTNHIQVNIHAAPGQDGGQLWDEFVNKMQQHQSSQARKNLYDPAFGF